MTLSSMLHRAISIVLGVLAAFAGVVAFGYTLEGINDLKFFKDNMAGGIVGAAVPGVLCASAFYMAYKLIFGGRSVPPS
ncbi:MAG: hypothetical protein LAP21_21505 [Acidobacteriia bacterium]|nr:hypothetical protein [Terriglobia bacterium]